MKNRQAHYYDTYYVAKQPILDRKNRTYGYELLFRSSAEQSKAAIANADSATIEVMSSGFVGSQDGQDQSKRIFINFTEKLLLEGTPRALPPSVTVIEILENIAYTSEVFEELIKLKQEGYLIAVDDFCSNYVPSGFLDIADIIKVDVLHKSKEEITHLFNLIEDKKALKLAEKVDNQSGYSFMLDLGFDLFQGFFFARPENLVCKTIKSSQAAKIRILTSLQSTDLELEDIVKLVTSDPSITYRLLRLLNSAAFGFSMEIESIQHAVALLGTTRMYYWLRMIVLADISSRNKPLELFRLALNRGKILEELASQGMMAANKPETVFLFGMLSLLDVMLDMPFPLIFNNLPLTESFKEGYTSSTGSLSVYLRLLQAFESNNEEEIASTCRETGIPPYSVAEASARAHTWTEKLSSEIL
jgi:c-di-GMP phosphodiesterase